MPVLVQEQTNRDTLTGALPIEILLVEDNQADVVLTKAALHDAGLNYALHVARDGEKALAFLRRKGRYSGMKQPDIVLLDLNLPRVDGHQVLAEMKADPALKHIPVIVLSGSINDQDMRRAYEEQAAKYLVKPVAVKEYFAIIRTIREFCAAHR